jgi:hypothetical protein
MPGGRSRKDTVTESTVIPDFRDLKAAAPPSGNPSGLLNKATSSCPCGFSRLLMVTDSVAESCAWQTTTQPNKNIIEINFCINQ